MQPLRTFTRPSSHAPSSSLVRLLFWNIWYGSTPRKILGAIKSFDCDALILFEVDGNTKLPQLVNKLGYEGEFIETNRFGWRGKVRGGIGLFSRLPVDRIHHVELRRGGRGPLRGGKASRRSYIEATLRISRGVSLTVGGTHLSYELPYDRQACAQEQETLIWQVDKHASRFVFGGDLNALPNSRIVQQLNERLAHIGPNMIEPSWPMRRVIKRLLRPRRFDYAFATRDVRATAGFGDDLSSDHRAIIMQLHVPSDC